MNSTEVTYYPESGRTRFANYRDGVLVSIFWKEEAANKMARRSIGTKPMLDNKRGGE